MSLILKFPLQTDSSLTLTLPCPFKVLKVAEFPNPPIYESRRFIWILAGGDQDVFQDVEFKLLSVPTGWTVPRGLKTWYIGTFLYPELPEVWHAFLAMKTCDFDKLGFDPIID